MNYAVDSTAVDLGPSFNATPIASYLFIIFIVIGSFFMLNLFVGVLFMNF